MPSLKHCCKKCVEDNFASAYGDMGDSLNDSFNGDLHFPYSYLNLDEQKSLLLNL